MQHNYSMNPPSAAMTASILGRNRSQALTRWALDMLVITSYTVSFTDWMVLWGRALVSLSTTPHT